MANWDPTLVTPTLVQAPSVLGGASPGGGGSGRYQDHHGLITLVLAAVAVLFILDRAGFRFAVTVGRR